MNNGKRFDTALYGVSERVGAILKLLPDTVKGSVQEIRLRLGQPIALTVAGDSVFVRGDGNACFYSAQDLPRVTHTDLEETFRRLCAGSVYAHTEELKNGFVVMKNGCRAGVCGTLTENGFMKDITSVNIRIAREIFGAANDIVKGYSGEGILIAGAPGSGKTTVLRDLVRQLSNGCIGKFLRVAVIDSRCEISASYGGVANDLGVNTDVLITHDKASGIEIALRTMFPDIIAFDEIGTVKELERVEESLHAGVSVVTTAHIGSKQELMTRKVTRRLIESGAIKQVALLPPLHGGEIELFSARELLNAATV